MNKRQQKKRARFTVQGMAFSRAAALAQELGDGLVQLSEACLSFGRFLTLQQLRRALTHPCTDQEMRALLQIASKGVVAEEDRLRAPAGLSDRQLLVFGQCLESLHAQAMCSLVALMALVNAGLSPQVVALPGSICEQCFDAPAVHVRPAPWGGEMGVCPACRRCMVE